ncbi:MAG: hypothetical protein K9G76_01525 [Bacteroidales bacterium]|nr:hypothetical protein [Bacteroidales bacterium]
MRLSLLIIFILIEALHLQAQFLSRKTNQFNNNGLKQGKWISFWDETCMIPRSIAVYKNGKETGKCYEYYRNGEVRLKFRYQLNRIRVKYFSEEGIRQQKGWAIMEYTKDDTHYYWHGKWKFYDEHGKLINITFYLNGAPLEENLNKQ